MVFVLGTDEAGYGPNLGPLCIAASAWQLPDDAPSDGLYDRLASVVASKLAEGCQKVKIADSKVLYKAAGTLHLLERGVLVALACVDGMPARWRDIWFALDSDSVLQIAGCPWHDDFDEPLPLHATHDEIRIAARDLLTGCHSADARLVELQSAILFPAAYNQA